MDVIKTERFSNIELYRIIVMLMIVAFHYVVNSGLYQVYCTSPISINSIFVTILGAWGKVGINCFVFITGYFMCTSNITLRKFLKLYLEVVFYNIVIGLLFAILKYKSVTAGLLLSKLIPINSVTEDFISCFLLFYFLIPFLNVFIKSLNKRQHILFISICIFIYSFLGTLWGDSYASYRTNYVTWFCILYFISSYIRLYNAFDKIEVKKIGVLWGGHFL